MSDRGKYHGQRLKAKDVLRLYAAGDRDFRGTILRGCNFRGTDLSGADFTGADIRSAVFVEGKLRRTKFISVQGGSQSRWWLLQLLIVELSIASSLWLLLGGWIAIDFFLARDDSMASLILFIISGTIVNLYILLLITQRGLGIHLFWILVFATPALGVVNLFLTRFFTPSNFTIVIQVVGNIIGAISATFAIAFSMAVAKNDKVISAFAIFSTLIPPTVLIAISIAKGSSFYVFTSIFAIIASLMSAFVHQKIVQEDSKFRSFISIGRSIAASYGTSFRGADLTGVSFVDANLEKVSLNNYYCQKTAIFKTTIITHARWHNARGLDRARLGTTNLQDPRVRNLLVCLNGVDQDLSNADLRGVNLAGATLHRINFKGANLNGATLEEAELHGANLTNAQCIGTDFTGAHLTGACLEAWNIDDTTIFKDIDCEYVFLKEEPDAKGNRERRPHNPDKVFQPGDFEKFFKEMLDTVQILIRQGIYPDVFRATLQDWPVGSSASGGRTPRKTDMS